MNGNTRKKEPVCHAILSRTPHGLLGLLPMTSRLLRHPRVVVRIWVDVCDMKKATLKFMFGTYSQMRKSTDLVKEEVMIKNTKKRYARVACMETSKGICAGAHSTL